MDHTNIMMLYIKLIDRTVSPNSFLPAIYCIMLHVSVCAAIIRCYKSQKLWVAFRRVHNFPYCLSFCIYWANIEVCKECMLQLLFVAPVMWICCVKFFCNYWCLFPRRKFLLIDFSGLSFVISRMMISWRFLGLEYDLVLYVLMLLLMTVICRWAVCCYCTDVVGYWNVLSLDRRLYLLIYCILSQRDGQTEGRFCCVCCRLLLLLLPSILLQNLIYLYCLCVYAHSVISPTNSPNLPNIFSELLMSVWILVKLIQALTCKLNVLSDNIM
jgi:hypothetical protein